MTPGAQAAAAIAVIDRWQAGDAGLDRVLAAWGRESRFAGSGDRRAVADLAYCAVRRLRSALWTTDRADLAAGYPDVPVPVGRPALIGSLLMDREAPSARFTGEGHAPKPLAPSEVGRLELDEAPWGVRLDVPDWLSGPDQLGAVPEAALERLRHRAPVFLRASLTGGRLRAAIARLAEEGIAAEPGPLGPGCLRVTDGARRLASSRAFADGLVEIQDAASQAVADLAAGTVAPGSLVLDLCAGAGGKILAICDALGNRGRFVAHDISAKRLAQLAPRASRAGLAIETRAPGQLSDLAGACDLVLVDAPCSGSGAWARNPDARWRLTPGDLATLTQTQAALIGQAAGLVRPGGAIVYATCSMMPVENAGAVAAGLRAAPGLTLEAERAWTPLDGGDGFYAAVLRAG